MEPLDTDIAYVSRATSSPTGSRLDVLLLFPMLGVLLMFLFIGAAIFQWDLSTVIDALMGIMLFLFAALVVLLFWAMAPRAGHDQA